MHTLLRLTSPDFLLFLPPLTIGDFRGVYVCECVCTCVCGQVPKPSQVTLHPHYSLQPGTSKKVVGWQRRNELVSHLTLIPVLSDTYTHAACFH